MSDCVSEWNLDGEVQGPLGPSLIPDQGDTTEWDMMVEIEPEQEDNTPPTVSVTMSSYALKSGETSLIAFSFSQLPVGFTAANVSVQNGVLSLFGVTGDPLIYTALFTPTAGIDDVTNVVTVDATWKNALGVFPVGSSVSANYVVHTTSPTVTITCVQTSPAAVTPLNLIFTLSEASVDFGVGDITIGGVGGVKSNFAGAGAAYTCDVAPSAFGVLTVDVAAGTFHDADGNANLAAVQFTITYNPFALNDVFTTNRLAGAVNGTAAEPGPGIRSVWDDGTKVSITGSRLRIVGLAGYASGNEYSNIPITRQLGVTLYYTLDEVSRSDFLSGFETAFRARDQNGFGVASAYLNAYMENGSPKLFIPGDGGGHDNLLAITLRAQGAYYWVKLAGQWCLMGYSKYRTGSTLYVYFTANDGTHDLDNVSIDLHNLNVPIPVGSDSFIRADAATLGNTDGAGHQEANGGGGLAWTASIGAFEISSNKSKASSLVGSIAAATIDVGKTDVSVKVSCVRSAGNMGVTIRYKDALNYIIAYHDGTNFKIDKVVGGVTTSVVSAALAYAPGGDVYLQAKGTSFTCAYNDSSAFVLGPQTIADADLQTGTRVGIYTTDTGNTFTDFVSFATGTGGEYGLT